MLHETCGKLAILCNLGYLLRKLHKSCCKLALFLRNSCSCIVWILHLLYLLKLALVLLRASFLILADIMRARLHKFPETLLQFLSNTWNRRPSWVVECQAMSLNKIDDGIWVRFDFVRRGQRWGGSHLRASDAHFLRFTQPGHFKHDWFFITRVILIKTRHALFK